MDPELAALILLDYGLAIEPRMLLPASKVALARRALGLPSIRSRRTISNLARRSGLAELEIRAKLKEGGVLSQLAQSTVPSRDVEPNTVHKIRRDLELDEEHGYDSDIFYNAGPRINEFIHEHRRILQQLAKL